MSFNQCKDCKRVCSNSIDGRCPECASNYGWCSNHSKEIDLRTQGNHSYVGDCGREVCLSCYQKEMSARVGYVCKDCDCWVTYRSQDYHGYVSGHDVLCKACALACLNLSGKSVLRFKHPKASAVIEAYVRSMRLAAKVPSATEVHIQSIDSSDTFPQWRRV